MDTARLERQLAFLAEIDKMKSVFRRNIIIDKTRSENDAEHSWHLAMCALVLEEYAAEPVDMGRVLQMTVCHDLVEVYAGDTFCYDAAGNADKAEREIRAADKLFALLPEDLGAKLRSLWEEFEAGGTPESEFANALDRIQPFILNSKTEGHTWKLAGATRSMVLGRLSRIKTGMPALWNYITERVDAFVKQGLIAEG